MPILEMTLTIPLTAALMNLFSATSAGPGTIPCRTWSCTVSNARYGLKALAP